MNLKRPKIVEQIILMWLIAVLTPLITIGLIIQNVSQQTMRHELNYSTKMIAKFVGDNIELYSKVDKEYLNKILNVPFVEDNRQIYVLDKNKKIIATNTKEIENLGAILGALPASLAVDTPELFNKVKNRPSVYYKLDSPDLLVIVNTTKEVTEDSINKARFRIILAISLAAIFAFFVFTLYTFFLYLNMRQLFRGITAISKGNYERRIHMIKNIFSPHEIYFLAKEFNFMAKKVSQSYKELSLKNIELERLDGFRNNLISAISHEFRTPLTSIIGYSSRLLRQDIEIDEQTKAKSLKIIKEQAQMLSRMVEDLLVVPEIESFSLKLDLKKLDLMEIIEKSMVFYNAEEYEINFDAAGLNGGSVCVLGDENRLIQVFGNLLDNALKYSKAAGEEMGVKHPVNLTLNAQDDVIIVEISNYHKTISPEIMDKLFEKFVREDNNITRTTRGTGLGLYIVRGLCLAMGVKVSLKSENDKFSAQLIFKGAR